MSGEMTLSTEVDFPIAPWDEERVELRPGATRCQEISFFAGRLISQWGKVAITACTLQSVLTVGLCLYFKMGVVDSLAFNGEQDLVYQVSGLGVYFLGKVFEGIGNLRKVPSTSQEELPPSPPSTSGHRRSRRWS